MVFFDILCFPNYFNEGNDCLCVAVVTFSSETNQTSKKGSRGQTGVQIFPENLESDQRVCLGIVTLSKHLQQEKQSSKTIII